MRQESPCAGVWADLGLLEGQIDPFLLKSTKFCNNLDVTLDVNLITYGLLRVSGTFSSAVYSFYVLGLTVDQVSTHACAHCTCKTKVIC